MEEIEERLLVPLVPRNTVHLGESEMTEVARRIANFLRTSRDVKFLAAVDDSVYDKDEAAGAAEVILERGRGEFFSQGQQMGDRELRRMALVFRVRVWGADQTLWAAEAAAVQALVKAAGMMGGRCPELHVMIDCKNVCDTLTDVRRCANEGRRFSHPRYGFGRWEGILDDLGRAVRRGSSLLDTVPRQTT